MCGECRIVVATGDGILAVSIVQAVFATTPDPRERAALLYACGAESGCQPIPQQGGGPGRGFFQIEAGGSGGRGVTAECANDPMCAASAFYSKWNVKGCVAQQGQLWQTNPTEAAYMAARCAEGGGSSAAANRGAPYSTAQRTSGSRFAQMGFTGAAGVVGDTTPAALSPGDAGYVPGSGCRGGVGTVVGNTEICPLGANDIVPSASGASGLMSILQSPDAIMRVVMIVGGLVLAGVSASKLIGITAVPVPV